MKEVLISFDTAKLAKEKGFDEVVSKCYQLDGEIHNYTSLNSVNPSSFYSAPTQSILQKWLREDKEIIIVIDWFPASGKILYQVEMYRLLYSEYLNSGYETYEEALEEGLMEALKTI